jgi:methionyl-tRNA formyltransferase
VRLRVVALGTTEALIACCDAWRQRHDLVGIVSMPKESRPDNSHDLGPYAASIGAAYLEVADINSRDARTSIAGLQPDITYSMWPKLLEEPAITLARLGTIGTHCTELPANRGRHPLHWMLALGLERGAVSFFKVDSGVDTGDILLQMPFALTPQDTIADALSKMNQMAAEGCAVLAQRLAGTAVLEGVPQEPGRGNYWRKRTVHDTIIDFRMSVSAIDRLVRSYSSPFAGAKILYRDNLVSIERTEPAPLEVGSSNLEPGRILAKEAGALVVKADDAAIRLLPRDPEALALFPDYGTILPPSSYKLT